MAKLSITIQCEANIAGDEERDLLKEDLKTLLEEYAYEVEEVTSVDIKDQ